jgi:hypothetical protein
LIYLKAIFWAAVIAILSIVVPVVAAFLIAIFSVIGVFTLVYLALKDFEEFKEEERKGD